MPDQIDIVWYIERDGQRFGPFSARDFERFEAEKQLVATHYVWRTGLDRWVTYAEFLSSFVPAVAPPRMTRCATCVAIKKLISVPLDLALTAFEVVAKPTAFAKRRIDAGPRDLYRALYFYFNLFTVAFLIGSSLTYLDFYGGASQFRKLATVALQIGAALPIIYIINIALRQKVRFSGTLQAVLYPDGIFLVVTRGDELGVPARVRGLCFVHPVLLCVALTEGIVAQDSPAPPPDARARFASQLRRLRVQKGFATARQFALAIGIEENRYTR